ncbi:MAG: hypothetical protein WC833_06270 [Bacteroidales bacterium]
MKKLFSMLVMLAFVLTLSAQEQKKEIVIKREGMMKANPAHLAPQFTPEQQKQMAEFKLNLQKEMIQIDNQLNEKRAQLKTLEQVEKPNLKSVYAKIDEITDLQNQKMKVTATHKNKVRSILTDEQRVKFDLMQEKGMMHRGGDKMMRRGGDKMMRRGGNMMMIKGGDNKMQQEGRVMLMSKQRQMMDKEGQMKDNQRKMIEKNKQMTEKEKQTVPPTPVKN